MKRSKLVLPAFLVVLLASAPGEAEEVKKQAKPAPVPAQEKFYVYGGNCSRSISLRGTYDTLVAAGDAAEKLRSVDKMRHVSLRTGDHARDYFGGSATEYKVYARYEVGCRLGPRGYRLHATVEKWDKAKEMADKLAKAGARVEIVGHYAPKTTSGEATKGK
jgi:hypothetical protein